MTDRQFNYLIGIIVAGLVIVLLLAYNRMMSPPVVSTPTPAATSAPTETATSTATPPPVPTVTPRPTMTPTDTPSPTIAPVTPPPPPTSTRAATSTPTPSILGYFVSEDAGVKLRNPCNEGSTGILAPGEYTIYNYPIESGKAVSGFGQTESCIWLEGQNRAGVWVSGFRYYRELTPDEIAAGEVPKVWTLNRDRIRITAGE